MATLTPILLADGGSGEALGINARVDLTPVLLPHFCCLLPEVLVVNDPAWPTVLLATFCNQGQVHKHVFQRVGSLEVITAA